MPAWMIQKKGTRPGPLKSQLEDLQKLCLENIAQYLTWPTSFVPNLLVGSDAVCFWLRAFSYNLCRYFLSSINSNSGTIADDYLCMLGVQRIENLSNRVNLND